MSKFSSMALQVDKPARMELLHPKTGEPLIDTNGQPAYIDLLSFDCRAIKDFDRAAAQKRIDAGARAVNLTEGEKHEHARLAVITVGWHLCGLGGEALDVPCTPENAAELYSDNQMAWLRDQVVLFASRRANFTPSLSKN